MAGGSLISFNFLDYLETSLNSNHYLTIMDISGCCVVIVFGYNSEFTVNNCSAPIICHYSCTKLITVCEGT